MFSGGLAFTSWPRALKRFNTFLSNAISSEVAERHYEGILS
jgi:hypothetical protein